MTKKLWNAILERYVEEISDNLTNVEKYNLAKIHEANFKYYLSNTLEDFSNGKISVDDAIEKVKNELSQANVMIGNLSTINNILESKFGGKWNDVQKEITPLLENYKKHISEHNQKNLFFKLIDNICKIICACFGKSTYQELVKNIYKATGVKEALQR